MYDAQSRPALVQHNGVWYSYVHNLQGDIIAIVDASGTQVVEYKYDVWGRKLSVTGTKASTLGALNPFRYRGYVFDEETYLYYLRARYYNPAVGKFVCADSVLGKPGSLLMQNIYLHHKNSPLFFSDPSGKNLTLTWSGLYYLFKILVTGGVSIGGGLLTDKIVKNFHNHRAGSFNQSQNYSPSQRRLPSKTAALVDYLRHLMEQLSIQAPHLEINCI